MSWINVGVAGASLLMSYEGQQQAKKAAGQQGELERQAGDARRKAAEFEANVMQVQAGQTVAASQRDAMDLQRVGRLAQSRALALSAASGGGASSPTVVNLIGNLAKESSYNAARALYAGEEKARLMKLQAQTLREQGQFAQLTGDLSGRVADTKARGYELSGYGTLIGGAGGMYDKYGRGGPSGGGGATTNFTYTGYDAGGGPAYG